MKLSFKKVAPLPFDSLTTHHPQNPIPAVLKLSGGDSRPETIYARNLTGKNFIEFGFNKETRALFEIVIVSIEEKSVRKSSYDWVPGKVLYQCVINEQSELSFSKPIKILRSEASVFFIWDERRSQSYKISKNCALIVDDENRLCGIVLFDLSPAQVYDIFGF